jgi:pyruvate/2-oxoglutarate dehydrogenase complex dihydrolipoamide dehydrogenase (E3) component
LKLCICVGAEPKTLLQHDNIIGIRDIDSVEILTKKLETARNVAIVGNGGIALELVHEVILIELLILTIIINSQIKILLKFLQYIS